MTGTRFFICPLLPGCLRVCNTAGEENIVFLEDDFFEPPAALAAIVLPNVAQEDGAAGN
ncbi:MAG: hypothetical protein ACO1TE_05565 [Prosthecobacter sp.]